MNTTAQKQSITLNGLSKQLQTTFDGMVKSLWRYKHGLELQFESENVSSWTLKGTPYNIVKEAGEYFSVIGQNRVSNTFKTVTECIKDAKRLDTHKVMQLAIMICEENKRRTKTQQK